jgi:type II secretory pathway component PulJ
MEVGMTLTDLLVCVTVSGLLLSATFVVLQQGQGAYAAGVARVDAQQSVRLAMERMAIEIRGAGSSPVAAAFSAIALAEPTRIVLQHDVDGNGVIAGPGETITYRLQDTTLRRDAGGGAQPVVNNVRQLRFTYRDARGHETTTADLVRSVEISLSAGPGHTNRPVPANVVAHAVTEVRLRNR